MKSKLFKDVVKWPENKLVTGKGTLLISAWTSNIKKKMFSLALAVSGYIATMATQCFLIRLVCCIHQRILKSLN